MKTNDFEGWLNSIRVDMQENRKGQTDQECVDASNENGKKIAEKYKIKVTKLEPVL
jgi:hypothetical protein